MQVHVRTNLRTAPPCNAAFFLFFVIAPKPRVEGYKSLWALNTSPPTLFLSKPFLTEGTKQVQEIFMLGKDDPAIADNTPPHAVCLSLSLSLALSCSLARSVCL